MNVELQPGHGWALAAIGLAIAGSWAVLLLQALFHDRRIAIVGMVGAVSASLLAVVPGPWATLVLTVAGLANAAFLVWFVVRYWRRPYVYVPISIIVLGAAVGAWIFVGAA